MGDPTKPAGEYPPYLAALFTSTMEFEKELVDTFRERCSWSAPYESMEERRLSDSFCSSCSFLISSPMSEPMLIRSALSSSRSTFWT